MKEYFYWSGLILNTAIATFVIGLLTLYTIRILYKIYKRTWLHYGWQTFRLYQIYVVKKQPMGSDIRYLKAFRNNNKMIKRMPMVMKKVWHDVIDNRIKELQIKSTNDAQK